MKKLTLTFFLLSTSLLYGGVNPQTGNFFFTVTDYEKQCHKMTMSIQRSYNSMYRKAGLFGHSWLSNIERKIIPLSNISLELIEADGYISTFYLKSLVNNKQKSVKAIIQRKKTLDIQHSGNPKGNGSKHYAELSDKMLQDQAYFLTMLQRYQPNSIVSKKAIFVSNDRKPSILQQHNNGFKRTFLNGDIEEYSANGELILEKNRHNTFIRYIYRNSQLKIIRNSCGHYININYDKKNRIINIQNSNNKTLRYSYDDQNIKNTLSVFKGIDGKNLAFKYDQLFRLTKIQFPDDEVTIVYDKNSGKVKQHLGPGTAKNIYSYSSSRGQNTTAIRDGENKKHTYTFIPAQNKTVYQAPNGEKLSKTFMACCGKIKSKTLPSGAKETYKYDDSKQNLIELKSNKAPSIFYKYNSLNLLTGIQKDKTTLELEYNTDHLLVAIKKNNLRVLDASYDSYGNLSQLNDSNHTLTIQRKNNGDITQIRLKKGNKTFLMDLIYNRDGSIKDRILIPNSTGTITAIEQQFKRMLDLLQLKSYLPQTS